MIRDSLLFCTLSPLVLGFASAFDTRAAVKSKWYKNIQKPWFNPPRYVFAPVWIYLYVSTGYALFLVRSQLPEITASGASVMTANWGIYAFWSQLLANFLWSGLYFVQREINLALADIITLSLLSTITTICFFSVDTLAGILMLPYVAWAFYATALTYKVKELNPNFKDEPISS